VRDAETLAQAVEVLLLGRAARGDLPVLLAAHALAADEPGRPAPVAAVAALDRRLDTVKLAPEEREGSVRVGRRLLAEGARLFPDRPVAAYAGAVRAGTSEAGPGHAAVAQGLLHAAAGVPARAAALAAAAGLASGTLTAAMRLGLIGHGEAQRLLLAARPWITAAVDRAVAADPADLRPSAPMLDIAVARHERADVRTFAS
jgi:urease accessory protein